MSTVDIEAWDKFEYEKLENISLFSPYASNMPKVSVIIPTLNEAKNLQYVLPYIPDWVHETIIVDGHSTDDTREVAVSLLPDVKIVEEQKRGKGSALCAGFAAATGDIIVMIDADGSMNPVEIPVYVAALLSGADYVKGSRFLQGGGTSDMTFLRRLGNMGLTTLVRIMFGGQYTDLCYGFNAFWADALNVIEPNCPGFEIETHMNIRALRSKIKVSEVPSFEHDRVHGTSNLNTFKDGWRVLKTIFREKLNGAPNNISTHWTWEIKRYNYQFNRNVR